MGALGELQDNVFEHSGRPDSGLVAYGASTGAFEFVVADAGRGVLREPPRKSRIRAPRRLWGSAACRRLRWRLPPRFQHRTRLRHWSIVSRTRSSHRGATISQWRPRAAALGRRPEPYRPGRLPPEGVAERPHHHGALCAQSGTAAIVSLPRDGGASYMRRGRGSHCGPTDRRSARPPASRTSPISGGPVWVR